MSSSESKASYPATPLKNSDTSSVPTDLTVSSGENSKVGMIALHYLILAIDNLFVFFARLFSSSNCTFFPKKSDDQTNIDKYRIAANIKEFHIISKLFHVKCL